MKILITILDKKSFEHEFPSDMKVYELKSELRKLNLVRNNQFIILVKDPNKKINIIPNNNEKLKNIFISESLVPNPTKLNPLNTIMQENTTREIHVILKQSNKTGDSSDENSDTEAFSNLDKSTTNYILSGYMQVIEDVYDPNWREENVKANTFELRLVTLFPDQLKIKLQTGEKIISLTSQKLIKNKTQFMMKNSKNNKNCFQFKCSFWKEYDNWTHQINICYLNLENKNVLQKIQSQSISKFEERQKKLYDNFKDETDPYKHAEYAFNRMFNF